MDPSPMVPPPVADARPDRAGAHPHGMPRWIRRPLDAQATRDLSLMAGIGAGLSLVYAVSGPLHLGLPCLLKVTTGWDCPLCGGTRMGSALFHGDLAGAWSYNPFALVVCTVAGLWLMSALAYQAGLLPRPLPRPRGTAARVVGVALLFGMVAFTVGRNLPVGPLAQFHV